MLCGEAQVDMGMWASWSVLRFLPGAAFILHSDGTITEESLSVWRRVVPQLECVACRDVEERMNAALSGLPHLSAWRKQHAIARQAIDYFLCGRKAYVLGLDSDVLCFKTPEAIINAIRNGNPGALWLKDGIYAYSMPEPEFTKRYGHDATRVNGGFWLAPRFSMAHMEGMDHDLSEWEPGWRDSYWSPQTLLAAAFSRAGGSVLDPARYMLGLGGHTIISSARMRRFSASAGGNPQSTKTLSLPFVALITSAFPLVHGNASFPVLRQVKMPSESSWRRHATHRRRPRTWPRRRHDIHHPHGLESRSLRCQPLESVSNRSPDVLPGLGSTDSRLRDEPPA